MCPQPEKTGCQKQMQQRVQGIGVFGAINGMPDDGSDPKIF